MRSAMPCVRCATAGPSTMTSSAASERELDLEEIRMEA